MRRRRASLAPRLWLPAAVAALACACGGTETVRQPSPGPDEACDPDLVVSPQEVDLGLLDASVDEELLRTVELDLHNLGCGDLHLAGVSLVDGSTGLDLGSLSSVLVRPQGLATLEVRFEPEAVGEVGDTLLIESDDPEEPTVEVPLRAALAGPELAMEFVPGALETAIQGCPDQGLALLESTGTADLELLGLALVEEGGPLSLGEVALPLVLAPGEVARVPVHFESDDAELHSAGLQVESSDWRGEVQVLDLSAQASPDEARQETWVQGAQQPVDLVLLLDLSASMGPHLDALPEELGGLVAAFVDAGVQAQLLAPPDDGCVGDDNVLLGLDGSTLDLEAWLEATRTTEGSWQGGERGMYDLATWLRSTKAGECNEGLLQAGALLQVVTFTDEPDQSFDLEGSIALAQTYLDDPGDLVISTVSGTWSEGCDTAIANTTLHPYVEETGGVYADLCATGWGSELAALALQPGERLRTFRLSSAPLEGTVRVSVDGAEASSGWSYEPEAQAVIFEEAAAPSEGSTVTVDYVVDPTCEEG